LSFDKTTTVSSVSFEECYAATLTAAMTKSREELLQLLGAVSKDDAATDMFSEPEQEWLTQNFPLLQDKMTWNEWLHLYQRIQTLLVVIYLPHPWSIYSHRILPHLSNKDLNQVHHILQQQQPSHSCTVVSTENLFLYLSKTISSSFEPIPVGLIPSLETLYQHSCVPNSIWEYSEEQPFQLQLVALYDLDTDEPYTISYHYPPSPCLCSHCCHKDSLNQWMRRGHVHFAKDEYCPALDCYRRVVQLDPTRHDVWHAMGAVLLTQGKFRLAQNHWRNVAEQHAHARRNDGIALQLAKQEAYRYFASPTTRTTSDKRFTYTSYFHNLCFITDQPVVSTEMCQQVIDWATQSDAWTTSRHYQVPTNDIPVHTLPKLLEWFQTWMDSTLRPLLAQQFHLQPNDIFVHDAFVVRYSPHYQCHYLPIHVDESTHSVVLALNEAFDGGGTYFYDSNTTLHAKPAGTVLSFRGNLLPHGGNLVTRGVRYIVAIFLYHDATSTDGPNKRQKVLATDEKQDFRFGFAV
jgi:tetratricopeptide (TPR) repeat protein